MDFLFAQLIQFIQSWGYIAIFWGMVLESANIPLPSELILGFAGYLVFAGMLENNLAILYGVLGGLFGSIISYLAGYYGGPPFVLKYGKYFFLSPKKLDRAQQWFDRYGVATVFFGRLLPVVRTFISLPAGFAKVNFLKFVFYTMLGSIPWTIAIVYAGRSLGEHWTQIMVIGHQASLLVIAILLSIAVYVSIKKNK